MNEREMKAFELFASAYNERAEIEGFEWSVKWRFPDTSVAVLIYTPDGAGDRLQRAANYKQAVEIVETSWREQVG